MKGRTAIKIALVLVIAGVVAALYFTPVRQYMDRQHLVIAVEYLRGLWYAPILFILAYAAGCIFAVPASLFIITAGVVWGWLLGGTYSMIGGVLGATFSFLVGRFVGEGMLERFGSVGRRVAKQVDHAGFKSLLILRLIPLFPFAVINYGAGVARVHLTDFVLATAVGLAPSNFVFAYSAHALYENTMSQGEALGRLAIVAVLLLAVVLVPSLLKRRIRT
ncbi:MAG TPA: VTT domain-containing protein [Thermoanaerobaculia bacterium]|jgi:phospholipase D1/2|nr:VTT domain-containing protein [Thermoanaerobaculia bacterium]